MFSFTGTETATHNLFENKELRQKIGSNKTKLHIGEFTLDLYIVASRCVEYLKSRIPIFYYHCHFFTSIPSCFISPNYTFQSYRTMIRFVATHKSLLCLTHYTFHANILHYHLLELLKYC
jgi:hypothetical protein